MDDLATLGGRPGGREPLGGAVAAYLSTRVDLLRQEEAFALADSPGAAPRTPLDAIQNRFSSQTGARLEDAFASFDAEPFESGPLAQWHRSRLATGERAIVKVVHESIDQQWNADLESSLQASGLPSVSILQEEFRDFVDRSTDLRREVEDLVELRTRCEGMRQIRVPRVHRELCGSSFLTFADPQGATLAACSPAATPTSGDLRLARRLCRAWLRLLLSARAVSLSLTGCDVLVLADGNIAFCGGPFHFVSDSLRDQIRSYLAATAVDDHQTVASVLLDLSRSPASLNQRTVRHQLRHTAPFRDGDWNFDTDSLSRALLAHGHRMAALGFRPEPALLALHSGLAALTRQARALAPGEDPFREAFQEFRLHQLFADWSTLPISDGLAPLAGLPRKLDRGLRLAAEDQRRSQRAAKEEPSTGSWSAVLGLLMALVAIALVTQHLTPSGEAANWIESIGALGTLLVGGLLLRAALR